MVDIIVLFKANLDAEKVYINKKYLRDPPHHTFKLKVLNSSTETFWVKLFIDSANWNFGTTPPGATSIELGSVAAVEEKLYDIDVVRTASPGIPPSDVEESMGFELKVYSDSGYANEVGSDSFVGTAFVEDIESWTDVETFNFDDGTAMGWALTNMSVVNERSIEADGYSLKAFKSGIGEVECECAKTISLPNRNKVRVSFFLSAALYGYVGLPTSLDDIKVTIGGNERYHNPCLGKVEVLWEIGWVNAMFGADDLKGQSLAVAIMAHLETHRAQSWVRFYVDRIVIAGKD